MKLRVAFATVTACIVGFVLGFAGGESVSPRPDPCMIAAASGPLFAEWVRQASMDGMNDRELTEYCLTLVR